MQPKSRITLSQVGTSRIEIKKSIFIGTASHVDSAQEAVDFVDEIKHRYPDARHNVYAWTVTGEISRQKSSDDGEPSGTAGMPILNVIEQNGLTDSVVCVTRYFGGILLGTGGLVRAYSEAASLAIKEGRPVTLRSVFEYKMCTGYAMAQRMISVLERKYEVYNQIYSGEVEFTCCCLIEQEEDFLELVRNSSGGCVTPIKLGVIEKPLEID